MGMKARNVACIFSNVGSIQNDSYLSNGTYCTIINDLYFEKEILIEHRMMAWMKAGKTTINTIFKKK